MCEIFSASSERPTKMEWLIPRFTKDEAGTVLNWGLGYYRETETLMEHTQPGAQEGKVYKEMFDFARKLPAAQTLLLSMNTTLSGELDTCDSYPMKARFAGGNWLFAHQGHFPAIQSYTALKGAIEGERDDSSRLFEYIRDKMSYFREIPHMDLATAFYDSVTRLGNEYPKGEYNVIMTNGFIVMGYAHYKPLFLYTLRRKRGMEQMFLTTLKKPYGTDYESHGLVSSSGKGTVIVLEGGGAPHLNQVR